MSASSASNQQQSLIDITTAPPPYDKVYPSEAEAAAQDAYWDNKRPEDWATGAINLCIGFFWKQLLPNQAGRTFKVSSGVSPAINKPWFARMDVQAKNIPRLMRSGFFWSADNVIRERGYIHLHVKDRKDSWKHLRTYFLKDLAEDPQWFATITVFTEEQPTLAHFQLSWLSMEKICWARAYNWDKDLVYKYKTENLGLGMGFNAIYDHMPLQGWWPWPKR